MIYDLHGTNLHGTPNDPKTLRGDLHLRFRNKSVNEYEEAVGRSSFTRLHKNSKFGLTSGTRTRTDGRMDVIPTCHSIVLCK